MSQTSHKNTPARRLGPEAKKTIALDALSGMGVTQAARKNAVCRNSVYVQKNKAEAAMDARRAKILMRPVRWLVNRYSSCDGHLIKTSAVRCRIPG